MLPIRATYARIERVWRRLPSSGVPEARQRTTLARPHVLMSASNGTPGLRSAGSACVRSTYKKATGAASSWFT